MPEPEQRTDTDGEEPESGWWGRLFSSLRFKLLLGLNLAILTSLGIFLAWGYYADWSRILQEKRSALGH